MMMMERGRNLYGNDTENLKATELRLGLPGDDEDHDRRARGCKRMMTTAREESQPTAESSDDDRAQDSPPVAKAQVIGWPPIRTYRKNSFQMRKLEAKAEASSAGGIYVKVSMNGAPYLRKIDLKVYKSYEELREALESMFKCFTIGHFSQTAASGGGSNYAVAYEDKDGDWMLAGDVPWRMFISSCKRLRIMRGSEANGLSSNS